MYIHLKTYLKREINIKIVLQIVPIPPKRVLKPLEPKPPSQQIATQPAKSSSKFFTSKPVKHVPEPVIHVAEPVRNYNAKPRRAAAERVTRQDYAESDSDESPAPVIVVAKAATKTLVSKGKPAASLIHQQQQQQQRSTRQQRAPTMTTGKTIRNSEESDASEESSSEEEESDLVPPKSQPNKFLIQTVPIVASSGDLIPKIPNVETPNESCDEDSNGGHSDPEPVAEVSVEPPLKVPPLKLILKPSQQQQQQQPEKRSSRRGARTRYTSDNSEPEISEKKVRTRQQSNNSENDFSEKRTTSLRTRTQSNNSENDFSNKVSRKTRHQSSNSENEFGTETRVRTRTMSNNSESEHLVEKKSRLVSDIEHQKATSKTLAEKPVEDKDDDEEIITLRHPSRTRIYGSRQSGRDQPVASSSAARNTRNKPLGIIEEEKTEDTSSTSANVYNLNSHGNAKPNDRIVEEEKETPAASENQDKQTEAPKLRFEADLPVKKETPVEKIVNPVKKTYGSLRNSRAIQPVPVIPSDPIIKPEVRVDPVIKPEIEDDLVETKSSSVHLLSNNHDLINFVPDKFESDLSSLTRSRTVASDTNVAAEFKTEIRARDRYTRKEEPSSSQPLLSSTKPSAASTSSVLVVNII